MSKRIDFPGSGSGGGTSLPATVVVAEDNFTRANENPVGPSPTGGVQPWVGIPSGSWGIVSNKLVPVSVAENTLVWNPYSDQFTFDFTIDTQNANSGLYFGYQVLNGAGSAGILIEAEGAATNYKVYYREAGAFSAAVADSGVAAANGDVCKLVVDGARWYFQVNSVTILDSRGGSAYSYLQPLPLGGVGFRASSNTAFKISHIKLTSIFGR